jgi:hypothetical protein
MTIQTEFEFVLPKGYVDGEGNVHRAGVMRLAAASDELILVKDPLVQDNPAYLTVVLLSRVITKLGNLPEVTPDIIEGLFAADLAYLEDFYRKINGYEPPIHLPTELSSEEIKPKEVKGLLKRKIFWIILLLSIAAIVIVLYLSPSVNQVIETYATSFPR